MQYSCGEKNACSAVFHFSHTDANFTKVVEGLESLTQLENVFISEKVKRGEMQTQGPQK